MYYSAGTYESFAHPEKPKDVDKKSAYIIGTGLAGLTAAFYLVRDGQMKGEHVHVFEEIGQKGFEKFFFPCFGNYFPAVGSYEIPQSAFAFYYPKLFKVSV